MSEVEEIAKTMETDEEFVAWLRTLPTDKKVGDPRLANDCPELRFLRAKGYKVFQVGLREITTYNDQPIPCLWLDKFQKDLIAKYFRPGARLREVTAGECLSVLRPQ